MTTKEITTTKTNHCYLRALMALAVVATMAMALLVGSRAAVAGDPAEGDIAPKASSESVSAQGARIATKTFSNSSLIQIPADIRSAAGRAFPYPSEIEVSGFRRGSRITNVRVNLNGLSHPIPDDIDMMLVGPKGQNTIIMSDVGGSFSVQNIILSLDDAFENAADGGLPDNASLAGPNSFGNYTPGNVGSGDPFPAPAPAPSTADKLSVFNGRNPNGTWELFALDDEAALREAGTPPDIGELAGGWSLEITAKRRQHH
jgi:hypothetical protein